MSVGRPEAGDGEVLGHWSRQEIFVKHSKDEIYRKICEPYSIEQSDQPGRLFLLVSKFVHSNQKLYTLYTLIL